MKTAILVILMLKSLLLFTTEAQTISKINLEHKADSLMSLLITEGNPGGAIGIVSGNTILMARGYGMADTEKGIAIDNSTSFDIASVSKQFTAFAILLLEKEGKVVLDNDIHTYLPDLPRYEHKITVRNLLQHTSGIASTDVLRLFGGMSLDERWDQEKEIELIRQYPQLNFIPGTSHVYSNAGYSLLAQIVNKVSGMTFPEYLESRIFNPLNMKSAVVRYGEAIQPQNSALGYKVVGGKPVMVSSTADFSYGGGNVNLNLNDMMLWAQNYLTASLGGRDLINRIFTPYNTLTDGDTLRYTYGFNVTRYKGVRMVEHSGGVPGFRSQFMIFPDDNLAIILMFNNESINTRRLATSIADILLAGRTVEEKPIARVEVPVNIEKAKQYAGNYQLENGMEMGFAVERDTFWLLLPGDARFQLFAEKENRFFLKAFDAQCAFVSAAGGKGYDMIWYQSGASFRGQLTGEKVILTAEALAKYAGEYFHNALKVWYPVVIEENKLTMYTPPTFKKYLGFDRVVLNHISGDKFLTDRLGVVEFTRDSSGNVDGFTLLDVGRLQNIRFSLSAR